MTARERLRQRLISEQLAANKESITTDARHNAALVVDALTEAQHIVGEVTFQSLIDDMLELDKTLDQASPEHEHAADTVVKALSIEQLRALENFIYLIRGLVTIELGRKCHWSSHLPTKKST